MSTVPNYRKGSYVVLDHCRAAKVVMERYGSRSEAEILSHIYRMTEQDDEEGAFLWLCVLKAYGELQKTQPRSTVLH
jgi:hypothetical protein